MIQTDVLIIGAGPAGIQAAIHAARKKVSVLLVGKMSNSAMSGTHIENYFGLAGTSDGNEILRTGLEQAKSFGCKVSEENIISSSHEGNIFKLVTENDETIEAKSVIIATGISRKKLGVPGERELFGKGVSYCASCDCNFYKGKVAMIVGDETEAAVSAELMTKYASKVYWVIGNVSASENVVKKAEAAGAEIIKGKVESINGEGKVNTATVSGKDYAIDGIFIELGAKSAADLAMDMDLMPEMDDSIKVKEDCSTDVPGIFACGDITGKPWQVAKAVGQGAVAGISAADYVRGVKDADQ